MKKLIIAPIVAGLASIGISANAQNLIVNGSFETSGYNQPEQFFARNPFDVYGWTATGNTGDKGYDGIWFDSATAVTQGAWNTLTDKYNATYYLPSSFNNVATIAGNTLAPGATQLDPDGGHFLALDGQWSGGISQTVTGLTVGDIATVSFYWGATQLTFVSGPITEQLQVSLGGQTQYTSVLSENTHYFSGWLKQTFSFIPTSTTEVLNFTAIGTPFGLPPMAVLDGVSLVQTHTPPIVTSVPEPSVWATMLAGVGLLAWVNGRRRKSDR